MSDRPQKFERTQERLFSAHHILIKVAKRALHDAEESTSPRSDSLLVAITFSALAIEAIGNAIGERLVPDWNDFESLSPFAKMRLLSERLGLDYRTDREPWGTLRWLGKFRNRIAHPKLENVLQKSLIGEQEANRHGNGPPQSKLEKDLTVENARRSIDAVDQILLILHQKIPVEDQFGIYSDAWHTTTRVHQDS